MPFRTFCSNKGCRAEMAPVIEKETMEVYCTECGQTINSVDEFMKRQLVSMGQTRRVEKKKLAYSIACKSCKMDAPPVLGPKKELLCSRCKEELTHVSAPFAELIRQNLKSNDK